MTDRADPPTEPPAPTVAPAMAVSWSRARVPRILSWIALGCYALAATGAVVADLSHVMTSVVTALGWWVTWPVMVVSYILSIGPTSWKPATLEIDERSLMVVTRTTRRIARDRIVSALHVDRPVGGGVISTVEIELAEGDRLTVRCPDQASAIELAASLGFGPAGARSTVSLALPSRRLLHPVIGFVAWIAGFVCAGALSLAVRPSLELASAPLFAIALYVAARRLVRPLRVTVGDDAIAIERLRTKLVPRSRITSVWRGLGTPFGLEIADEGHFALDGLLVDRERLAALGRLVEERLARSGIAPPRNMQYARSGETVAAWKARLRVAMDRGGYRTAAAPVDEASAIVGSALVPADERVGAAIALRIAGEPPEKIRIAARATVDADVRTALEAVADDDDRAIEKAVRRMRW